MEVCAGEMDKAIDTTAKALATLSHHVGSGKEQGPSKSFQTLIRMIGEAKTKHVSRPDWRGRSPLGRSAEIWVKSSQGGHAPISYVTVRG